MIDLTIDNARCRFVTVHVEHDVPFLMDLPIIDGSGKFYDHPRH